MRAKRVTYNLKYKEWTRPRYWEHGGREDTQRQHPLGICEGVQKVYVDEERK